MGGGDFCGSGSWCWWYMWMMVFVVSARVLVMGGCGYG